MSSTPNVVEASSEMAEQRADETVTSAPKRNMSLRSKLIGVACTFAVVGAFAASASAACDCGGYTGADGQAHVACYCF